jgi:hypothetical protein
MRETQLQFCCQSFSWVLTITTEKTTTNFVWIPACPLFHFLTKTLILIKLSHQCKAGQQNMSQKKETKDGLATIHKRSWPNLGTEVREVSNNARKLAILWLQIIRN